MGLKSDTGVCSTVPPSFTLEIEMGLKSDTGVCSTAPQSFNLKIKMGQNRMQLFVQQVP